MPSGTEAYHDMPSPYWSSAMIVAPMAIATILTPFTLSSPRSSRSAECRSLFRGRLLERILHRREGLDLDGAGLAADLFDFADIDVLHDVAVARIDRDRASRAFPFHALHGPDDGVGIGIAIGLFQRLVNQVHAVIAADRNKIGAMTGRLLVGGGIVLVHL